MDRYAWEPLANGGHMAFRNFSPTATTLDYVKVYRKKAGAGTETKKTAAGK